MKCPICSKTHNNKKYCSQSCYWKSMEGLKNERAPNWQGSKVGKSQIHKWLDANYGKPKSCDSEDCRQNSKVYEWCLKKGKEYKKDRCYFLRLCRSCHRRYDWNENKQKQAVKNLKEYNPYYGRKMAEGI